MNILKPAEISRDNYRLYFALNYLCYLGVFAHLLFIPLFYRLNLSELAVINMFSVVFWILGYLLNRSAYHVEAFIVVVSEAMIHAVLATFYLGWDAGFHYYLFSTILFISINHRLNVQVMIFQALLVFAAYIFLYIYTHRTNFEVLAPDYILNTLNFMNVFINFSAFGIQGYFFRTASIQAEEKMERLASTDPLTNLFNRRKMEELMSREIVRFQRDKKVFTVAITDIDNFKQFNDNYGHDCGDYVLQEISKLMQESLRTQDLLARWGGEEFLIMLPDTNLIGGKHTIEKLRETIENKYYEYKGVKFSVTMTFGMTIYNGENDIDNCIKHADEMLYAGKRGGRNRVVATSD
ncbi:MAG: GGDEF domain-containing protein [Pseudomonadales bacterium]|nr:GGDEF domain-containing protein [Pseudomonadales bacterium]